MLKNLSIFKSEKEVDAEKEVIQSEGKDRNFVVVPDGKYGLYRIEWEEGGGPLPARLRGHYTTVDQAKTDINTYRTLDAPSGPEKARSANYQQRKREEREDEKKAREEALDAELKAQMSKKESNTPPEEVESSEDLKDGQLLLEDHSVRYKGEL